MLQTQQSEFGVKFGIKIFQLYNRSKHYDWSKPDNNLHVADGPMAGGKASMTWTLTHS